MNILKKFQDEPKYSIHFMISNKKSSGNKSYLLPHVIVKTEADERDEQNNS